MLRIVTSKFWPVEEVAAEIAAGKRPGHVLLDLAQRTESRFEMPGNAEVTAGDKVRGKLFSTAELWALARRVAAEAGPEDTLFCTGEDVGIPLAAACAARRDPPKLFVTVHNLNRPRGKAAMALFRPKRAVTGWLTPAPLQATFLTTQFGIAAEKVHIIPEQTDTQFYTPGAREVRTVRPVIASVGLEQRDYRTLAEATQDLPVDVRISGFSKDAQALRNAFPDPLPENMTRKFYEWGELVELYRSAAIVVVPLFPNMYVAGITTFLEAMACRKPVIATRTEGLAGYCDVPGICATVPPCDADALRGSINSFLHDQSAAAKVAARAHEWLIEGHTPAHWIKAVIDGLGKSSPP